MIKLERTEYQGEVSLWFYCAGCDDKHRIIVEGGTMQWGWNGSMELPTFTPSILVKYGHYADGTPEAQCGICISAKERGKEKSACSVCHSFVTNGEIQYLSDCTHALAGKTVALMFNKSPQITT